MIEILIISLPSFWGRVYVDIENYWMILLTQYLSSFGISTSIIDAALEKSTLSIVESQILKVNPKIVILLVTKKNWELVNRTESHLTKKTKKTFLLVSDDSFEINTLNPRVVSVNNMILSVYSLLNRPIPSSLYFDSIFLKGRDYLKHVLMKGGEFEVVGSIHKNQNYFPSDYQFDTSNYKYIEHNFSTILKEIKTICTKYNLKKCNIIDNIISNNLKCIDEIKLFLDNNNLSQVKLGLFIDSSVITENNIEFIRKRINYIYKVVISSSTISQDHINFIKNLTDDGFRVKVLFSLFNDGITIEYIQYLLNVIRKRVFFLTPKSLVSGTVCNPILQKIKRIMEFIYYKIFHDYHLKIIEFENQQKYEIRIGLSKDYESIGRIQKEVDYLSFCLNNVFLVMFDSTILQCSLNCIDDKKITADLLKQYKNDILDIGGVIDAHLSSSCRI
ncbi:MAG: hypothetical protein LBM93_09760 [Oscillospiraceae bacterium]|jgi:hypothetical protein|nr:hypothetical protein [Oscillospiraceae bacterium]